MAEYATTKGQLLERARSPQSTMLKGVALEGGTLKGMLPLRPCICVTEPCPCDTLDDIIVWVPTGAPHSTHRRDGRDDLASYPVTPDQTMLVELQVPMTLDQLRTLKTWAERSKADDGDVSGNGSGNGVMAKGKPLTPAKAAAAAFAVGYALGEKLDEATGLSDAISDWAAEHIPWPW